MKRIVAFALFLAVGCILAAGCIGQTNKDTVPEKCVCPACPSFTARTTNTTVPEIIVTADTTSPLQGSLRVSISGLLYPANLSVILDNETVGTVTPAKPLFLIVSEGNHTVIICVRSVCEQETVTTRFGRYVNVDFSERLLRDVEFPNPTAHPTARILDYYRNGDAISVEVEFINPSTKDLLMSVVVSCRYTYIDDRTLIKIEDTSTDISERYVNAGQRITEWQDLYLGGDNILNYERPVIKELTIN
jgi:hypothetical protein